MLSLPTEIVGSVFLLRHLQPTRKVAKALYDVFVNDANGMQFWLRGEKIDSVDVVLDGITRAYACENMYMYYILDNGQIVGEIGFASIIKREKAVYVDYWLAPSVRGNKAIDRFLPIIENLAFVSLNMNKVLLGIDVDNIASRKIAERNGYTLNVISKSGKVWVDGSTHDECEYSKLKSEWLKENKNA